MLVSGSQSVILVLTNSVSQGVTADWIGQLLLQAVLNEKHPVDLELFAERAAASWRGTHQRLEDALEKGRKPNSEEPPCQALEGRYWHKTREFYLEVLQEGGGLKFSLNGKPEQVHRLSHYADDTFVFLPPTEACLRSGLFHYAAPAWLLHSKRDGDGKFTEIHWDMDTQSPFREKFLREQCATWNYRVTSHFPLKLADQNNSKHLPHTANQHPLSFTGIMTLQRVCCATHNALSFGLAKWQCPRSVRVHSFG